MVDSNVQSYAISLSLRALVVFCLITVGAVAGCGVQVPPEQKAAMAKIGDLGGRVNFMNGGYKVDLTNTPVEDRDLACLKDIGRLKSLDLQGTRVTDAGLEHLQVIASLESVAIQRTGISREGAATLQRALPKADVVFK